MLYARALDFLLRSKANVQNLTAKMIDEVAYNGTLIIETLVKNITYQSTHGKNKRRETLFAVPCVCPPLNNNRYVCV